MSKLKIKSVLFDFDGVVVDSEQLHIDALLQTTADHGVVLSEDYMLKFVGRSDSAFYHHLIEKFDNSLDFDVLTSYKNSLFNELIKSLKTVPGFLPFVEELMVRKIPRAIVTSSSRESLKIVHAIFPFSQYISELVCEEDTQEHKPMPAPYLLGLKKLNASPEFTLVIEDSVNGIKAGKAAGCKVFGITTSLPKEMLYDAGADGVFDSYDAIRSAIELIDCY